MRATAPGVFGIFPWGCEGPIGRISSGLADVEPGEVGGWVFLSIASLCVIRVSIPWLSGSFIIAQSDSKKLYAAERMRVEGCNSVNDKGDIEHVVFIDKGNQTRNPARQYYLSDFELSSFLILGHLLLLCITIVPRSNRWPSTCIGLECYGCIKDIAINFVQLSSTSNMSYRKQTQEVTYAGLLRRVQVL